jgi:Ca2+-binding EF-hand superfamily protein
MGAATPEVVMSILDKKGDGCVTLEELTAAEAFFPRLTAAQAASVFKGMDGNHDGHVCAIEFLGTLKLGKFFQTEAAMVKATGPLEETVQTPEEETAQTPEAPFPITEFRKRMGAATPREAFNTLDGNEDGHMSSAELLESRTAFSPAISQAQAESVFKALDVNKDNGVSADEFLGPIARGHYSSPQAGPEEEKVLFDCEAGMNNWEKGWSEVKKTWCCTKENQKCPEGFIAATDFKKRLGAASVHDAFQTLDANGDGFVDAEELTASKTAFVPAMSSGQAAYAAKGLDSDGDGKVSSDEFSTSLEKGAFFMGKAPLVPSSGSGTPMPAEAPITMEDFKKRMGSATPQDALSMLDADTSGSMSLEEFLAKARAFVPALTKVQAEYVFKGLDAGKDEHVDQTEFSGTLALGKFFQPPKAVAAAAAAVVRTTTIKPSGAGAPAEEQPISLSDFKGRLGRATPQEAFNTLDTNTDGSLDIGELVSASSAFVPPISKSAFEQVLKKLDADGNGLASSGEFVQQLHSVQAVAPKLYDCKAGLDNWAIGWSEGKKKWCCEGSNVGCEVDGGAAPAQLSLGEFVKRMRSSFTSPPDAFGAMDADHDKLVSLNEFLVGSEDFQSPLTSREALYAFQGFDANSDNKVGAQEFYTTLRNGHFSRNPAPVGAPPSAVSTPPILLETFAKRLELAFKSPTDGWHALDKDASGGVSREEFVSGVGDFPSPLTEAEAKYAFDGFDVDHDSKVGLQEFLGTLKIGHFFQTQQALDQALPESEMSAPEEASMSVGQFANRTEATHLDPKLAFEQIDTSKDGHADMAEFIRGTETYKPPLTGAEAAYVFHGLDANHDKLVSKAEFVDLVAAALNHSAGATQANTSVVVTTPVNMSAPQGEPAKRGVRNSAGDLVSAGDLQRYEGVPVIISGTAQVAYGIAPSAGGLPEDSTFNKQMGPLFGEALGEEMGVDVHVSSAEDMPNNKHHGSRRSLILWTADAGDGGAIEGKLLDEAEEVERRVHDHVKGNMQWLQSGWVMVWSQATFNYYGPKASQLPQGQKLTQELGRKPIAVPQ